MGDYAKSSKSRLDLLVTPLTGQKKSNCYQFGNHNGTFSSMWGFAAKFDSKCKENCLPSCQKCRKTRISKFFEEPSHLAPDHEGADAALRHHEDNLSCKSQLCSNWDPNDTSCDVINYYPTNYDQRKKPPDPQLEEKLAWKLKNSRQFKSQLHG